MISLQGEELLLRALEPTDLPFLYAVENDESFWEISSTTVPFSNYTLHDYLENAHRDIYEVKQLRLVIVHRETDRTIGLVDLFDFDPKHQRAGVGILIADPVDRGKGFAQEALQMLCNYVQRHLHLHQLYANISEGNKASVRLFEKAGFALAGTKKDWIFTDGAFKDEWLYQKLF
ncbi:MAG: GNAT family N-acetyltransferase [Flavobacteriaceae bacterium]|nr:GNAT family N-acetyltransferase [Flavobacteriaceae bacterium]